MTRLDVESSSSNNDSHNRSCNDRIRTMKESGEWERLQQHLMAKLVENDTAWRDHLIEEAKDTVRKCKGGVLDVTIDHLVADLVPAGVATVPVHVKNDMMEQIRKSLQQQQQQGD